MGVIGKILIANRGEIAVRIIQTAKRLGIQSIAVYAEDDMQSRHVSMADEAFLLEGQSLSETYLNQQKIIQLAKAHDAQAVHPGYGFLSENAEFAKNVEREGLVFIGATPEQIALMGEKTQANEFVKDLGLPVIPNLHGAVNDIISKVADFSFPLLVKASAGGGGKGMQIVYSESELPKVLQKAKRQATEYFSNGEIFVEKFLLDARHIEVQIFGDGKGGAVHLFERECSIQRRYQKLIEESPAVTFSDELKEKLFSTALIIAKSIRYRGAGTVEFLVDASENFYFLEMNTRIQVEHPITEMTTGIDLIEWQLQIAAGKDLPKNQNEIEQYGHAIELRLCAEDPLSDFYPASGKIDQLKIPNERDFRFDSFLSEGLELSPNYDSLLGKLICFGNNREEAIKSIISVSEKIILPDIKTNLLFLRQVLKSESFQQNRIDTRYIETHIEKLTTDLLAEKNGISKAIPLIAYFLFHFYDDKTGGPVWKNMGYFRFQNKLVIELDGVLNNLFFRRNKSGIEFHINKKPVFVSEIETQKNQLSFKLGSKRYELIVNILKGSTRVQIMGHQFSLSSNHILEEASVNKKDIKKHTSEIKNVFADLFGKVIKLHVKEGEEVLKNQVLLTIESMKTEFRILSPNSGLVKQLYVDIGSVVQDKQLLVEFETKNIITVTE